jgi:DNA-binding response OmpR family regulator
MGEQKQPVLLVEDDIDIAEIFGLALKTAGFEVETVHDGAVAMDRLTKMQPVLVALDLHLPNVSGVEILRAIRADERLADTPVILLTADQHLAQSVANSADLVLLKPISVDQLSTLASRLVSASTSHA